MMATHGYVGERVDAGLHLLPTPATYSPPITMTSSIRRLGTMLPGSSR